MTAEQHANLYEQHEWKHPTQVAGIPWKNPVATASGTFQYAAVRWFYDVSQLGAVTTKGVSPVPWEGNPGIRTAEGPSSNINAVGLQNPGVDHYLEDDLPKLKAINATVIANVAGHCDDDYAEVVSKLDDSPADMLEINVSCPNVSAGGMSVGTDPVAMFEALKSKLDTPLGGMATSFSTSLFGLAGSLIVGFLDLQSGHAQNRFYNELEEWLSHITRLPSSTGIEGDGNVPAYVQALLEQTVEGLDRMQRSALDSERERRTTADHLAELNTQLGRLAELVGRESRDLSALSTSQEDLRTLIRQLAQQPAQGAQFSEDLRAELRLLSRTIAAALGGSGTNRAQ